MHTYLLVLLLTLLASVCALSGDRKWLLNMMLGLPEDDRFVPPTYNPTWTPMEEDRSLSQGNKWPSEESSNQRNIGDQYSIEGLNSDYKSDSNVEKKWPKHSRFHFSGFICCNQPPTPHPKTKRHKGPSEESFRSIILKGIARSMARDRLLDKAEFLDNDDVDEDLAETLGNINYGEIDPRYLDLTLLEELRNNGNQSPDNKLYPSIKRRRVTVRSKRDLPEYHEEAASPSRYGRKRSWDPPQQQNPLTPLLVFGTSWDSEQGPSHLNDNFESPKRSDNSFKDYFMSVGNGR